MNPLEQEVIPPVFAPLPVGLARLHAFGAVGQYGTGNLFVQAEQVAQHVLVVGHVIVYRNDDSIGEILQGRDQFPVRADVSFVVAYFKPRVVFGQLQQLLGNPIRFKLCVSQIKHHLVGQDRTVQDGLYGLDSIRYCCRK